MTIDVEPRVTRVTLFPAENMVDSLVPYIPSIIVVTSPCEQACQRCSATLPLHPQQTHITSTMHPVGADAIRKAALADARRPPSIAPSTLSVNTNLGAYDNKLVSSSLSQLPSAGTDTSSNAPSSPINSVFSRPSGQGGVNSAVVGSGRHDDRPSFSSSAAAAALTRPHLGIATTTTPSFSSVGGGSNRPLVTGVESHTHPSHPSSPWSVLSLHVLPLFNGTPLAQSIEDLK